MGSAEGVLLAINMMQLSHMSIIDINVFSNSMRNTDISLKFADLVACLVQVVVVNCSFD